MTNRALWLALVLALPSCKSGEPDKTGLDGVKARGTLRVAMTGVYPPFNFFDETNTLAGFDVDVAGEIAERLGVKLELVTLRWDGIIAGLTAGRYDVVIGSMAITPAREKAVDFSTPYYVSGAQLFARPDTDLAKSGTLAGAVMGVNLGTTYEAELKKRQDEVKEIRTYSGIPEILVDLGAGRLDGFVTDKLVGLNAAKKARVEVVEVGAPLYTEHMGIALKKGQPKLLAAVNDALAATKASGRYAEISIRWFGRDIGGSE